MKTFLVRMVITYLTYLGLAAQLVTSVGGPSTFKYAAIAFEARSLAWATSESASSWSLSEVIKARLNSTSPKTPIVTSRPPMSGLEGKCQLTTQSTISFQYSRTNPRPTSNPNISEKKLRDLRRSPSVFLSLLFGPLIRGRRGRPSAYAPLVALVLAFLAWLLSRGL